MFYNDQTEDDTNYTKVKNCPVALSEQTLCSLLDARQIISTR